MESVGKSVECEGGCVGAHNRGERRRGGGGGGHHRCHHNPSPGFSFHPSSLQSATRGFSLRQSSLRPVTSETSSILTQW